MCACSSTAVPKHSPTHGSSSPEALEYWVEVLELRHKSPEAIEYWVEVLELRHKSPEALEYWVEVLELRQLIPRSTRVLGRSTRITAAHPQKH